METYSLSLIIITILLLLFLVITGWVFHLKVYAGRRRLSKVPEVNARQIASWFINDISSVLGKDGIRVGPSNSISGVENNDCIFDIKLIDDLGENHGYIIINASKKAFPICEFSLEGPSLIEKFATKDSEDILNIMWLTPTYSIALDKDGKIAQQLGTYLLNEDKINITDIKRDTSEYIDYVIKEIIDFRRKKRSNIRKAWKNILLVNSGGGTSEHTQIDRPVGDYVYYEAEGWSVYPSFEQIPPNTGVNDTDNKSGCGPTAWVNYIGWHNLVWSPDILRGSQNDNGCSWGDGDQWETYIDRMSMELATDEYLNVFGVFWNETGYNRDGNMEKGFEYIEDKLKFDIFGKSHYSGGVTGHNESDEINKVKDAICNDHRPIIIKTPNHFCVAGAFLRHTRFHDPSSHWVQINTGWGYRRYLSCEYLEQHWYMKQVTPRSTKKEYNLSGSETPSMGKTKDLWIIAWKGDDNKLHTLDSATFSFPSSNSHKVHNIYTKFGPVIESDDKYFYLAVVGEDNMLNIYRSATLDLWDTIPIPQVYSRVRPAMIKTGGRLTFAFDQKMGFGIEIISSINFERRFPRELFDNVDFGYWVSLGITHPMGGLSMISKDDILYLLWMEDHSGDQNGLWCYMAPIDREKNPDPGFEYIGRAGNNSTRLSKSDKDLSITICGKSIYLALPRNISGSVTDRISIYRINRNKTINWGTTPYSFEYSIVVEQGPRLMDRSVNGPGIFSLEDKENTPWIFASWIKRNYNWLTREVSYSLNIRKFTIDHSGEPLNYLGHP